jgi:hypothetical protein
MVHLTQMFGISVLQALFEDVTEAMHLLSHVLHAISDSAIDFREVALAYEDAFLKNSFLWFLFSQDGPLYVRSRAGGSEASEPSVQSAGVSLRVRTPRFDRLKAAKSHNANNFTKLFFI